MDWKETELESLLESLIDYRGKTPQKTDRGIPLITAKIIKRGTIAEPNEFIAEENYDSWMVRGIPMAGDVVLTTEAPLGEVAQLDERKIALAQRVVCLRGKKDVLDNTYLKYYFLSAVGHKALTARETGTTVLGIKQSELRKVKVVYPPFNSQRRIASILSSLDRKIDLNNKINAQLEEMAQAIFKSWFVDFEPFKDGKFVESELGMIPEGWRVGTLGEICTTNLRSVKGKILSPVQYLDTGSITENIIDGYQYLDPAIDKIPSRAKRLVQEGDIVFSTVRPNQKHYGIILNPPSKLVVSTGFCVITSNRTGYTPYIYQFLKQDSIINKLQAIAEQSVSTYPSINASDIENLEIVIPVDKDIQVFAETLCTFNKRIAFLLAENLHLSQLRDTLLPKLMNGEIEL